MTRSTLLWAGSFGVGLLSVLPYLYAFFTIRVPGGNTLHFFYQDSELVYLARIREILEGNFTAASPMFLEYKEALTMQQPYGEALYALASFGNPELLPFVALISKFLFPAFLFFILYLLTERVGRLISTHDRMSRYTAFGVALLITLGYEFNNLGPFWDQVFRGEYTYPHLSLWTRIVNPITGALGLFFVSYVLLTVRDSSRRSLVILGGIALGLLSGYIFSFALGMLITFFLCAFALVLRDWKSFQNIGTMLGIALLINLPYLASFLTANTSSLTLTKTGLILTHLPMHNKILILASLAYVGAGIITILTRTQAWRDVVRNPGWQWGGATLLACFVVYYEQLVTGKTIWPGHFVQYTIPFSYIIFFTSVVMGGVALTRTSERFRSVFENTVRWGGIVASVVIVSVTILTIPSVFAQSDAYRDTQRIAPTLEWLSEYAKDPCVVFPIESGEILEKHIVAYTHCDVYHSSWVFASVPEERIMHNYVSRLRVLGVKNDTLTEYLNTHAEELREYFFEDWVDKFGNGRDIWLLSTKPESLQRSFIPRTKEKVTQAFTLMNEQALESLLKTYTLHYIMIDTHYMSVPETLTTYPIVFEKEGVVLIGVPW